MHQQERHSVLPLRAAPLAVTTLISASRTDGPAARPEGPLARRRLTIGYTQERLAEILGVSLSTVGRWERGVQVPQPWQRPDLAKVLGVTLEDLDLLLYAAQQTPTKVPDAAG
jgi:DNA-binding XRE family transcriptional regulator